MTQDTSLRSILSKITACTQLLVELRSLADQFQVQPLRTIQEEEEVDSEAETIVLDDQDELEFGEDRLPWEADYSTFPTLVPIAERHSVLPIGSSHARRY